MALQIAQHGAVGVATHPVLCASQTDAHKPSASKTMQEGNVIISQEVSCLLLCGLLCPHLCRQSQAFVAGMSMHLGL